MRFQIVPNAVVQLNPASVLNKAFAGCFMVVTEVFGWGAQGYVQSLGNTRTDVGGQAYYRANWEDMEFVGMAVWTVGIDDKTEGDSA